MSRLLQSVFFVFSVLFLGFMSGFWVGEFRTGPYRVLSDGIKTLTVMLDRTAWQPYYGDFRRVVAEVSVEEVSGTRFAALADQELGDEAILVNGGFNQYLDLCPEFGCLAVIYDRAGEVLRATPFRPEEIFAADKVGNEFPHEITGTHASEIFRPLGVEMYDNGDLLVTFQSVLDRPMFPYGAGVARVRPDGSPVWFRFDYSHHWATLLPDGNALVPSLRIATENWTANAGKHDESSLPCSTGRPHIDTIQLIDPDGNVLETIDLGEAMASSNWSAMTLESTNACDPLHLNFVDVIDSDFGPGVSAGDLVVSLRNISAFAVIDRETSEVKLVRRGNFTQQHSVHHLDGSRFLMFDNRGGDEEGTGSRLLEVDILTGTERRIFPKGLGASNEYSSRAGQIDLSEDRTRALVSVSELGHGYEVDLGTGEALLQIRSIHDVSRIGLSETLSHPVLQADLFGMSYVALD